MKKTTIHAPNYKDWKIGYTITATCVMENPHKWGLTGNSFRLWAYLAARIKKEQYFNGRTIKTQLTGIMGESAVAAALKKLCELGFCTKQVNHNEQGQYAGWAYTFYAIPKDRDRVQKISPDLCEKLTANGWFDLPEDGNPSSGDVPDDGNPRSGEALFKGKDETQGIEENQGRTPSPLSEKEEGSVFPFRERGGSDDESSDKDTQVSTPGIAPSGDLGVGLSKEMNPNDSRSGEATFPAQVDGRWRSKMLETPVGRRVLDILRPEQIPDDKALRSISNQISRGNLSPDYLAFLEQKKIRPNQKKAEREGDPLYSIAEILTVFTDENWKPGSPAFKSWRNQDLERLKALWRRVNRRDPSGSLFYRELEEVLAKPYRGDLSNFESSPDDSPSVSPFEFFAAVYYHDRGSGIRGTDPEPEIIEQLTQRHIWDFQLQEAELNSREFTSLWQVVDRYRSCLPRFCTDELNELRQNWDERRQARKDEIRVGFVRIGATPPKIELDQKGNSHHERLCQLEASPRRSNTSLSASEYAPPPFGIMGEAHDECHPSDSVRASEPPVSASETTSRNSQPAGLATELMEKFMSGLK